MSGKHCGTEPPKSGGDLKILEGVSRQENQIASYIFVLSLVLRGSSYLTSCFSEHGSSEWWIDLPIKGERSHSRPCSHNPFLTPSSFMHLVNFEVLFGFLRSMWRLVQQPGERYFSLQKGIHTYWVRGALRPEPPSGAPCSGALGAVRFALCFRSFSSL